MLINRRIFRYFDWIAFLTTVAIVGTGLLFVYSATYIPGKALSLFFKKQLFGACSGFILYGIICAQHPKSLARYGFIGYIITIMVLCYTIASGWLAMGARRWISLYFIRIQPAELVKLLLPACFAYYWSEQTKKTTFIIPLLLLSITFFLILKQPDLGTALIILFVGLVVLWYHGLSRKFFTIMLVSSLLCAPIFWKMLHSYQKQRILVLLGYGDKQGSRYQTEQSKVAIGSGGFRGKGYLHGTINKLAYLPEDHTDFIFAVIAEEWGFIGAIWIIILFTLLFTRLILLTAWLKSHTDQLIVLGLMLHILFSAIINMSMVVGILPIVGIPLPLCSYGISNMWVTLASLGWIQGITMRRFS